MRVLGQCTVCGGLAGYTCVICGQLVCVKHYHPREGVCDRCYKKMKRSDEWSDKVKYLLT